MGNTPAATIEDNKISFALPSKFPFSYSNHPQGLKTSNSEKNGVPKSTAAACRGGLGRGLCGARLHFPALSLSPTGRTPLGRAAVDVERLEGRGRGEDGLADAEFSDALGWLLGTRGARRQARWRRRGARPAAAGHGTDTPMLTCFLDPSC